MNDKTDRAYPITIEVVRTAITTDIRKHREEGNVDGLAFYAGWFALNADALLLEKFAWWIETEDPEIQRELLGRFLEPSDEEEPKD